jgi:uncharacterized protein YutE (UPF0331/DUF86 family)
LSPIEKDIVTRKLAVIVRNLEALTGLSRLTRQEYGADLYRRKAAERLLQELIEAAIDINTHLIVVLGGTVPDSYFESFLELGSLHVIGGELAQNLAPSAGLRNRLVHEYDDIDDSIVYESMDQGISLYTEYVRAIKAYIDTTA